MLYADDMSLFLAGTQSSQEALPLITEFGGVFLGLKINQVKSTIIPQGLLLATLTGQFPHIKVASQFKYLGITISFKIVDYITLNLVPLISHFRSQLGSY